MKKIIVLAAVLTCAVALEASAQDATKSAPAPQKKPALTEAQKQEQKELLAKYDTNKDGKLDKEEKAKMSADDKKKLADAGLGRKKKATK